MSSLAHRGRFPVPWGGGGWSPCKRQLKWGKNLRPVHCRGRFSGSLGSCARPVEHLSVDRKNIAPTGFSSVVDGTLFLVGPTRTTGKQQTMSAVVYHLLVLRDRLCIQLVPHRHPPGPCKNQHLHRPCAPSAGWGAGTVHTEHSRRPSTFAQPGPVACKGPVLYGVHGR